MSMSMSMSKTMTRLPALLLVGCTALLAACANAPLTPEQEALKAVAFTEADPRRGEEVRQLCFTSQIDSFGPTSRNAVVVREGVNDYYLLEVFPGCFDLDGAQALALKGFSGCLSRGDRLRAFSSAFGPTPGDLNQRCSINRIYRWNPDATLAVPTPEGETEVQAPAQTQAR
jgi:hypothetical protein